MDRPEEEVIQEVIALVQKYAEYPLGQPYPVVVTLTDEQWAAVSVMVGTNLIAQRTNQIVPDWIREKAQEGYDIIKAVNVEVSAHLLMEKMEEEKGQ